MEIVKDLIFCYNDYLLYTLSQVLTRDQPYLYFNYKTQEHYRCFIACKLFMEIVLFLQCYSSIRNYSSIDV